MQSISSTFSCSDWIKMTKYRLIPNIFSLLLLLQGCGTGVGNPSVYGVTGESFTIITSEYASYDVMKKPSGIDCGSFTQDSSPASIESGQDCMRSAFASCHPAKYLLNQSFADGTQFTSFVAVYQDENEQTCKLGVHTASNNPGIFQGKYQNLCDSISPQEQIEFACRNN